MIKKTAFGEMAFLTRFAAYAAASRNYSILLLLN